MSRRNPLDPWTDQVLIAFPTLTRPQATVLALYSFGMIFAQRCGLNSVVAALGPFVDMGFHTLRSRLQEFYQPAAAKSGNPTSGTRRHHLFRPTAGLGPQGLAVQALGLGPGCHQLGRRLDRLVDQRRLPRLRHARRLEDPACQRGPRLETRVARLARGVLPAAVPGLDRDRDDRPRTVRPLALPGDRRPGLASPDADHQVRQVPQAGRQGRVPVSRFVPKPGRRWQGRGMAFPKKPEKRLGCTLLACWDEGYDEPWFVVTDLALRRPRACGMGCGPGSTRVQAAQERRLAMAEDTDDRLRPCRAAVAGAGGGHAVRAGRGRGLRGRTGGPRGDDPRAGPRRDGGYGRDQALGPASGGAVARPAAASPARAEGASAPHLGAEVAVSEARAEGASAPRSGTKERLVSVFRQGLSALFACLILGHVLPRPHWRPEPWLELRAQIVTSQGQPPTPIPINPS